MEEERVERRLAAIFCADVVGYSRLMGADEEKTLAALKAHRRELIDPLIDQHRGRIFKTTGDGMLIEFASVVDAVRVQRGMEDRNANLPEAERIRFRIGIRIRAATLTPSPNMSPSSTMTSPRLMPMRKRMRSASGRLALRSSMPR